MGDFWKEFFSGGLFMPHGHCYLWQPGLVWLQVISNGLIGFSYVAISSTLAYLVYRLKGDMPFRTMYLAFGAFIVLCGWTHFIDVYVIWRPAYWFDSAVRVLTAIVSAATAMLLPRLIPDARALARGAAAARERGVELETAVRDWQILYQKAKDLEERRSEAFANVSHELRTPLTLILGPLEHVLAAQRLPEEDRRTLTMVLRNAQQLHDRVDDLLDAAKLEAGEMAIDYAEVDAAQLVHSTAAHFESLAAQRGIRYSIVADGPIPAELDTDQIQRVLQNLLSNAFKFTPQGGRVRCAVCIKATGTQRAVSITVGDSGPGIASLDREAVFERFRQLDGGVRRRAGGTGLGLTIARDLVGLHGGSIEVDDAPEGGALLRVELPACAPPGVAVRRGDKSAERASVPLRVPQIAVDAAPGDGAVPMDGELDRPLVLIVEDNSDMREFVAGALGSEFRTAHAPDGATGLERALALRPDLVLTDVMMPGMSGDALVRELRTRCEVDEMPVLLLTAKADEALRVRMLREGAQDYVIKPFAADELRARVGNLVRMKRSRAQLRQAKNAAEAARDDLEAFSYSVAHDLRAPLRGLDGFSQILLDDHADRLDDQGKEHLQKIRSSVRHMAQLIDDLLSLARLTHSPLRREPVDLSTLARSAAKRVRDREPDREVELSIAPALGAHGDPGLLGVLLENLIGNAWKFSGSRAHPRIEVGRTEGSDEAYYVRDNGVGFDMAHATKLFGVFQRLHSASEFPGTGIGLAIVQRVVRRHGGRVWAEGEVGKGATFYFTLPDVPAEDPLTA